MPSSELYANEPILEDGNYEADGDYSKGLELAERPNAEDYAYAGVASQFTDDLLIPRSNWQALIEEYERTKSRVSDQVNHYRIPPKNQGSLNYCWIYAPVHAIELNRVAAGMPYYPLAAAQAGAVIKQGRNVGGWGRQAVQYIAANGIASEVSYGSAPQIERSYKSPEMLRAAQTNRVTEWIECKPKNLDQFISMLLRGYCGAIGLDWWRHEVTACEPIWLDGEIAVRIRNQWQGWGSNGFGILRGAKMLPNDCVFPIAVSFVNGAK